MDIPYYKISRTGKIMIDEEEQDKIEFVYLSSAFSRVLFQDSKLGFGVLCASQDGKIPTRGTKQEPGPCSTCANSKWQGQGKAPACAEVYSLYCYDLERKQLFCFQVKRASLKPWRRFGTQLLMCPEVPDSVPNVENAVVIRMMVEKEKKDKMEYFLPVFSFVRVGTNEEIAAWKTLHKRWEAFRLMQEKVKLGSELGPKQLPLSPSAIPAMKEIPQPPQDQPPF